MDKLKAFIEKELQGHDLSCDNPYSCCVTEIIEAILAFIEKEYPK